MLETTLVNCKFIWSSMSWLLSPWHASSTTLQALHLLSCSQFELYSVKYAETLSVPWFQSFLRSAPPDSEQQWEKSWNPNLCNFLDKYSFKDQVSSAYSSTEAIKDTERAYMFDPQTTSISSQVLPRSWGNPPRQPLNPKSPALC